jgi:pimeloyl-ACP methyl ester carboxylesterase
MYLRPFETPGGREAMVEHIAALDHEETEALAPKLKEIAVPTAIIWGEDDPFIAPETGVRLKKAIKGSGLFMLPGVRHYPPETVPESVAEILKGWLS